MYEDRYSMKDTMSMLFKSSHVFNAKCRCEVFLLSILIPRQNTIVAQIFKKILFGRIFGHTVKKLR
jgi:hypothetical protein